jgi:hypothetical protein
VTIAAPRSRRFSINQGRENDMLSRRAFLLRSAGLAAGAATALILPSWVRQAARFVEAEGRPLIEPPRRELTVINAVRLDGTDDYRLTIGDPFEEPPKLTWYEFFERYYDDEFESFENFAEEMLGQWVQPFDEADSWMVLDTWLATNEAPDTAAYQYLETMDIGPTLGAADTIGRIDFVNGPCPGNDSRFVSVPDLLSLSLLQKRLNHIDGTTLVRLVNSN